MLLIAAAAAVFSAGCSKGERSIEYDGFVLTQEPSDAPRVFPPGFVYPGSRPVMGGVYTLSPYASTREGVLIYESDDALPQIQAFYLRKFEVLGWQIIQSQEKSGEVFLLAENLSRRLFTVILRGGMPATVGPPARANAGDANPTAPRADTPLEPLASADTPETSETVSADSATKAPEVVQIKLYIKQAGLR